jgi:hypothetical protein
MTPHDLLVDAARLGVILAEFAALCLAIWLIEPFRRELIMRNWRREKFDAKSLQRLKDVVDAIPLQEMPRAEKNRMDLVESANRMLAAAENRSRKGAGR